MTVSVYSRSNNPLSKMVRTCCLVFWMVLYSAPLWSFDFPESLQFHGFASQGYSLTSENNFFGHSQDNGSFDYTEIGANASWLPLNHLQLSGQLLFRRAGETDPQSLRLDYGLLDYTMLSDETDRWGLRLGRIKNPVGFYNETRDIPFTKPSILLPQSIYPDYVRSAQLSSDGSYIYGEHRSGYGDFFLNGGIGYPPAINREWEGILFENQLNGEISYLARLLYEWNNSQLRAAVTYYKAKFDYKSDIIPSGSLRSEPWIFSLQYNAEHWSLTTEYSLRKVSQPVSTMMSEGYYIQGSYRFSPHWEGLLRYDVFYLDQDDKNGKKFAAKDPFGHPPYSQFAKDWTAGLTWKIFPDFMLRTEYHRIDGTAWLFFLDNPNPSETSRSWQLFMLLGAYRF